MSHQTTSVNLLRICTVFWQFLLPQHLLSRWTAKLANCRWVWLKNHLIRLFINRYHVDMTAAKQPDYTSYPTFNAFFTREIKPELRPIVAHPNIAACPVDGCVSQAGTIKQGRIFQAKGHYFSLTELLGGSHASALPFWDGHYATLYLAPKDYHRVHMPFAGKLEEMIYIPGCLFSVNQQTTAAIPQLFSRNERVVALFSTAIGPMAVVMVGAMVVAGIETTWAGLVAPSKQRQPQNWRYIGTEIALDKGEEMGRFQLGSTVIVLFANADVRWAETITAGESVLMGSRLAYCG